MTSGAVSTGFPWKVSLTHSRSQCLALENPTANAWGLIQETPGLSSQVLSWWDAGHTRKGLQFG